MRPLASSLKLCALGLLVGACGDGDAPLPAEQISTGLPDDDDDAGNTEPATSTTTAAGAETEPSATTQGDPSRGTEPDTTGDPSSTGAEPSTESDTTSPPVDPCIGRAHSLIADGFVTASSEYDTLFGPIYEAELAVDGDIATSWFSEGPNVDGTESTFEWYTQADHCIDRIVLRSNGAHANPDFHQGFGFGHVRVEVINTSGVAVFSEDVELDGSPDPDVDLAPAGLLGNQVLLSFSGHESEACGGFAELAINGREER